MEDWDHPENYRIVQADNLSDLERTVDLLLRECNEDAFTWKPLGRAVFVPRIRKSDWSFAYQTLVRMCNP